MDITLYNLFLQWLCHFLDVLDFCFLEYHIRYSQLLYLVWKQAPVIIAFKFKNLTKLIRCALS